MVTKYQVFANQKFWLGLIKSQLPRQSIKIIERLEIDVEWFPVDDDASDESGRVELHRLRRLGGRQAVAESQGLAFVAQKS